SARDLGALIETVEFDKYVAPLGLRDAETGVVDVNSQMVATLAAADQDAARWRIFDGIGDEILNQPPQQPAVRTHHQSARHEWEAQALGDQKGGIFNLNLAHQLIDAKACKFRTQRTGIEP